MFFSADETETLFYATRKRSCEKVMFLQVSVIVFMRGVMMSLPVCCDIGQN